ncbi:MAG: acylphosphatase [Chloroflexi bacterium]|nr:acylphosphatase [Chloroflexota bacterium]
MEPAALRPQRLRATIRGRVQGVGFRFFVARVGRRLNLCGHVRNLPGGRRVEVVAQGPPPALDALVQQLRAGPPLAIVESVTVAWEAPAGDLPAFAIRA